MSRTSGKVLNREQAQLRGSPFFLSSPLLVGTHTIAGDQAATLDLEVALSMRASAGMVEQKDGKSPGT